MILRDVRLLYGRNARIWDAAASSAMVVMLCAAIAILYPPLASSGAYMIASGLFATGSFVLRGKVSGAVSNRPSAYVLALYVAAVAAAFAFVVI